MENIEGGETGVFNKGPICPWLCNEGKGGHGRAVIKISKYVLIDRYKNQKLLIWKKGMWKNLKKIADVLIKDFLK